MILRFISVMWFTLVLLYCPGETQAQFNADTLIACSYSSMDLVVSGAGAPAVWLTSLVPYGEQLGHLPSHYHHCHNSCSWWVVDYDAHLVRSHLVRSPRLWF